MSRFSRLAGLLFVMLCVTVAVSVATAAQGRGGARRSPPRHAAVIVSGHVFIGGYFYDPFFGPYPWWTRSLYPH
jgi:hypothetical protein